ncbi:redoxin domain-containing protein [Nostocoides sp. F2B08]|uniref:peroxiredoxin n=1 Tax=Nostocoides sp. F2B08 TaxID=2653936 RepID=UPI001263602B|nr:peroxiredoxin [Tetrasphaera sp. F2B08]KAB7744687.1 redoxin domain-containing protein [Tetrasphaera sp. F2B08]
MTDSPLEVGATAPDFTLPDQNGVETTLSAFRGSKNVLLVFYPFAFSGICTGELHAIRDDLGAFVGDDVQVLAISCDPVFSLRGWADLEAYFFPLLSDFWPHGEVSRAYGVFHEAGGNATRGTFLIDTDGVIRWTLHNPPGEGRDFGEYRAALTRLRGAA